MSFMLDDDFDTKFLGNITDLVKYLNSVAPSLNSKNELMSFLSTTTGEFSPMIKLKALVSLIGLSEERLKRVISLVRYKFLDHSFNSEWTVEQISNTFVANSKFRELVAEFFLNGRGSIVGADIPLYYMRNFKLTESDFIEDLQDFNYVSRILNDNELQGKYSNKVGAHVESLIKAQLEKYKAQINPKMTYDEQKEHPILNKNVDFLIPNVANPLILIESSYHITTGSGQSKRADQLVDMATTITKRNASVKQKAIIINYCDGFGWLGRQNDLRKIYDNSNYVLNQKHLYLLDEILEEHFKA